MVFSLFIYFRASGQPTNQISDQLTVSKRLYVGQLLRSFLFFMKALACETTELQNPNHCQRYDHVSSKRMCSTCDVVDTKYIGRVGWALGSRFIPVAIAKLNGREFKSHNKFFYAQGCVLTFMHKSTEKTGYGDLLSNFSATLLLPHFKTTKKKV